MGVGRAYEANFRPLFDIWNDFFQRGPQRFGSFFLEIFVVRCARRDSIPHPFPRLVASRIGVNDCLAGGCEVRVENRRNGGDADVLRGFEFVPGVNKKVMAVQVLGKVCGVDAEVQLRREGWGKGGRGKVGRD
jgi:hypothetical protein